MATASVVTSVRMALHGGWLSGSQVIAGDPGVKPNTNGLPGLGVLQQMVGALLTWGLCQVPGWMEASNSR